MDHLDKEIMRYRFGNVPSRTTKVEEMGSPWRGTKQYGVLMLPPSSPYVQNILEKELEKKVPMVPFEDHIRLYS